MDNESVRDFADKEFGELLKKPENLRGLLLDAVPQLAGRFDYSRANFVSPKFRLPDGRGREADLLFEIPYRLENNEQIALVCILIEHQSRSDPRMAFRMLLYLVLYWEKQFAAWEAAEKPKESFKLPPVLPIVFHTGTRPWGSARSIEEMLGEPDALHPFAPKWAPLFWELSAHNADELLNAEDAFLQALAIVRVGEEDTGEVERVFRETFMRLEPLHGKRHARWKELLQFVFGWLTHRRPKAEHANFVHIAETLVADRARQAEVHSMVETYADYKFAEGKRAGEAGHARRIIVLLGSDRLGQPDSATIEALNSIADVDLLDRLVRRISDVNTWADLLKIS